MSCADVGRMTVTASVWTRQRWVSWENTGEDLCGYKEGLVGSTWGVLVT